MKNKNILIKILLFYFIIGISLLNANNLLLAYKDFKKAIRMEKNGEKEKANKYYKEAFLIIYKNYQKNPEDPILNYWLGKFYFHGYGVKKDLKTSLKYLIFAYKNGTDNALCEIYLVKKELKLPKIELDLIMSKINKNPEVKNYCQKFLNN